MAKGIDLGPKAMPAMTEKERKALNDSLKALALKQEADAKKKEGK